MMQTPSFSIEQGKKTSEQKKQEKTLWKRFSTKRFSDFLHEGFVLSNTVLFIFGLALSYALVQKTVVDVLIDFLTDDGYLTLRGAIVLTNVLDLVSTVFKFVVTHISEAYTGPFSVIIFCTAAYTMGLMLLYLGTWLILPIGLIALGKAAEELLGEFFDYQISEKLREKCNQNNKGEYSKQPPEENNCSGKRKNLWSCTASFTGACVATFWLGNLEWSEVFKISSLFMGSAYLLFFCGIFCYYLNESSSKESPLTTIYRVLMAAIRNRRLPYPTSKEDHYSDDNTDQGSNESGVRPITTIYRRQNDKGHNEGSNNDMEDPFYTRENDEVHVLPREASFFFLFLDKAAITDKVNDAVGKGKYKEFCTAEQVRDVKSLYLVIPLAFTFFAYSLTFASGNTYFVMQTQNLNPKVGGFPVPVVVFFVLQSLVAFAVRTIQPIIEKLVKPTWSIAVGMFCSALCCIAASRVEQRRLHLIKLFEDVPEHIPLNIMVLTPQYFLLGLMEGFAEYGVDDSLRLNVPKSMKKFVEPWLLAIGNVSSILFVLIFHSWIKDSINHSHLDRYFLMLASLNFVSFGAYVCWVMFKLLNAEASVMTSNEVVNGEGSNKENVGTRYPKHSASLLPVRRPSLKSRDKKKTSK